MKMSTAQRRSLSVSLGVIIVVALGTFSQLTGTGHTTHDDMQCALLEHGSMCSSPFSLAKGQGRLFTAATYYLALPLYGVHNGTYRDAARLGALSLAVFMFGFLVARLFASARFGVFAGVLVLGLCTNSWTSNLLTSYPLTFHLGFTFFLLSLVLFHAFITSGRWTIGWWSSLAFFLAAVTYEIYLPLVLAFVPLAFVDSKSEAITKGRRWARLRLLAPIACAVACYIVPYVGFRLAYPTGYDGNTIGTPDSFRALRVLWQFSISGSPGYFLFARSHRGVRAAMGPSGSIVDVALRNLQGLWILKGAVLAVLCYGVPRWVDGLDARRARSALPWAVVLVFVPNSMLALTPKHQDWVATKGFEGYLTTHFSYFALVFVALLGVVVVGHALRGRPAMRTRVFALLAGCLFCLSVLTDAHNACMARDQRRSHAKWIALDAWLRSAEFDAVEPGSTIYAPSLWMTRGHAIIGQESYWSRYVLHEVGKDVVVTHQEPSPDVTSAYFLSVTEGPTANSIFTVFARLEPRGVNAALAAREVAVSAKGHAASLFLFGSLRGYGHQASVSFGDGSAVETYGTNFVARVPPAATDQGILRLRSDVPVLVQSLVLAASSRTPRLSPMAADFGDGFYSEEGQRSGHFWRWSKGEAEIRLENSTGRPQTATLSFDLTTLRPRKVWRVAPDDAREILLLDDTQMSAHVEASVVVPAGISFQRLKTDLPASRPEGEDPRTVAFAVHNLFLEQRALDPCSAGVNVEYGSGFHAEEGDRNATFWRWSQGDAEIVIENLAPCGQKAILEFGLETIAPRRIFGIAAEGGKRDLLLGSELHSTPVSIPVVAPPGRSVFRLVTDAPAARPNNGDSRELSFAVRNLAIRS